LGWGKEKKNQSEIKEILFPTNAAQKYCKSNSELAVSNP
jgi:hypothetical protein